MNTQTDNAKLPSTTRVLTGITTSGTPHLGNYVGSIRPSVLASQNQHVQSFYFLADYHALIKIGDPERVQRSTLEIAASWLAAGVDPALLMVPATISASYGFMMPVGTPPNAIVFGTGMIPMARMAREGLALNFIGIAVISTVCYLLVP